MKTLINIKEVELTARLELHEEKFRKAVDVAKERMRRERWWHRLFPWRIVIIRRYLS